MRLISIVVLGYIMVSCSTRTPEEPTGIRGTFLPPTTPTVVIDNFRNAVEEKNTENFMSCLSDVSNRSTTPYVFQPSSEARARFQSIFDSWTLQKERQAFLSMIARLTVEQRPTLIFQNANAAFTSPDSTVYVADYTFAISHGLLSLPEVLTGTMVFTITPEPSGQWSISRWSDARRQTDSTEDTWSLLKAQFAN